MVRQVLDLFGQAVGGEAFEGLDNAGVHAAPALLEQTPIAQFIRICRWLRLIYRDRLEPL
jgi:hypothetical protein